MRKTQRRKVYLQAYENLENGIGDKYLCGQLAQIAFKNRYKMLYYVGEGLDEFDLFEPVNKENGSCWWVINGKYDAEGLAIRKTCMLLCYEMTKS